MTERVTYICTDCGTSEEGPRIGKPEGWRWWWSYLANQPGGAYVYCPDCPGPCTS